jgi:hypothetical protein
METIIEAKQYLRDNFEQGVKCPCCKQNVKLYNRKLHTVMALMLVKLYKLDQIENGYHHISNYMVTKSGTNDFSKLRYWGLVTEKSADDSTIGRTSGYWAITHKGKEFVRGNITVPSHVQLFDGKKYGESDKYITISDALGSKFDYREMMTDEHI